MKKQNPAVTHTGTKTNANPSEQAGTVILSPHSDDAALSLGGVIQKQILIEPVTLVTVFGRSNYLRKTAFQNEWREVTRQRMVEDRAFATATRLNWKFLDFPEAGLRIEASFTAIFSTEPYTTAACPVGLSAALREILDSLAPRLLIAPMGLGGHHDHLLIREMARDMGEERGIVTIYFEDLPYAAEYSATAILKYVEEVDPQLQLIKVPITSSLAAKLAALRLYGSQIGPTELEVVSEYATRWHNSELVERLWCSSFPLAFLDEHCV